jgi:hypothetical protein
MAKASTTAWQKEVRKIIEREGVTWAQAKKIRAKALKATSKATAPRKFQQYRSSPITDSNLFGVTILSEPETTPIVHLVTKAEEFVNACGGDLTRALDVLHTFQKLFPKIPEQQERAAQETRTLTTKSVTNGSAVTAK